MVVVTDIVAVIVCGDGEWLVVSGGCCGGGVCCAVTCDYDPNLFAAPAAYSETLSPGPNCISDQTIRLDTLAPAYDSLQLCSRLLYSNPTAPSNLGWLGGLGRLPRPLPQYFIGVVLHSICRPACVTPLTYGDLLTYSIPATFWGISLAHAMRCTLLALLLAAACTPGLLPMSSLANKQCAPSCVAPTLAADALARIMTLTS
jgi:hypothetical protein